ncbi:glycosyltransferase family 2 protein [Candidatus Marinimicrobia bacterium MT.SAG.3]|nr:glycosyltransferase family 2 protein [Candidatus Marinimicrobia bacterium MT.SAG.3]
MKISTLIICFNAERTIRKTLKSIGWSDEIIVIDSFSTDKTPEICKEFDLKFIQKEWQGFGKQRRWAVEQANNDWIFFIDTDEEVSIELKNEIVNIKKEGAESDVYAFPRKVYYMNRWITHSGWYPDHKARLFNKHKASWDESNIHEILVYEGEAIKLKGDLYHYTYRDIEDQLDRVNRYSTIAAEELISKGIKPSLIRSILGSIWRFNKLYFLKLGFLDGLAGLTIASMESYYVMVKYFKHAYKYNSDKTDSER